MRTRLEAGINTLRQNITHATRFDLERRRFITEVGPPILGLLGAGGVLSYLAIDMQIEARVRRPSFYGRFIDSQDGRVFSVAETPRILHITLIPETAGFSDIQGKILVRREPHLNTDLLRLSPDEVRSSYASPVFGEGFNPGRRTVNSKGTIYITTNGESHRGGQWLMFSDAQGNPLSPYTSERVDLGAGEKPFYTTNDFQGLALK